MDRMRPNQTGHTMNRRGFLGDGLAGILGALIGRRVIAQERKPLGQLIREEGEFVSDQEWTDGLENQYREELRAERHYAFRMPKYGCICGSLDCPSCQGH